MADLSCDVAIVGAGISGAILARRLAAAGLDVVVLEAGEATGLTWEGYQANIRKFLAAPAKVPNSAWPNSPAAPSPNVLDIVALTPEGPPGTNGYFVQTGPIPFGSDYQRSRGGTTLHWYGHSIRMLPADFEMHTRYGVGVDWPIGYDDLLPWYEAAEWEIGVAADVADQERIGVRFSPGYVYPMHRVPPSFLDRWLGARLDGQPVTIGGTDYTTGVVPVPGGRNSMPNAAYDGGRGYVPVGAVGRPETGLRCEGNASCIPACPAQAKYSALKTLDAATRAGARILHQTVATKVGLAADGTVNGIDVLQWTGNTFPSAVAGTIRAERYVLAAHSVENAKLLLMSGAANSSDQVGRNLMDHPFLLNWALVDEPLGTFRGPGSTSGIETLRDGPYRAEHSSFRVDIDNWGFGILGSPITDVSDAVFGDGLHGRALRDRLTDVVPRQLMIGFLLEQLPDPENRVTLSPPGTWTDALGLPRPVIRYDIAAYTRAGAAAARACAEQWFDVLGAEDLTEYGSGRSPVMHQAFEWNGRPYATLGAGHLCGTHRMGRDPSTSVVDSEQRSWDHRNLFVTGAGSMPTIGTSNPTLTLAALSCRTAAAILEDLA
ncbi:MAG TPA: GMC family oxidoreductase [Acidimicrobiales bacterium]|nr:GMC family oxidoreductase [Acidimicrobiales bacterium]